MRKRCASLRSELDLKIKQPWRMIQMKRPMKQQMRFANSMILKTMLLAFASVVMTAAVTTPAQAQVFSTADESSQIRYDVGYFLKDQGVNSNFRASQEVNDIFNRNAELRGHMPGHLPPEFNKIIEQISNFIVGHAARGAEQSNGMSDMVLATRIVRASFCFGTDPYMAASTMVVESHFNNGEVSKTGAVGLTQMTSSGLDEVNDQLGNVGPGKARANVATAPILMKFIGCYLADGSDDKNGSKRKWHQMWEDGVIPPGTVLTKNRNYTAPAKKWLVSDVDRVLIYGQILLKTYLAEQNPQGRSKGMTAVYEKALRAYNGEPGRRKNIYAQKVIHNFDQL
jgi:hypothetical protein